VRISTKAAGEPAGPLRHARLPSLTGLRWLAAFMVWGFHLQLVNPTSNDVLSSLLQAFSMGGVGVSFFFVLSGFVLVWSAPPGDTVGAFLQRRFAKIYPNHAVAFVCAIVLVVVSGAAVSGSAVLSNLLLINGWLFQPGYPNAINPVSWTLCCEAFFYLILPFLLPRLRRVNSEQLYLALALIPVAALLIAAALREWVPDQYVPVVGFFPPMRYHEFLVGVLVGELVVRRQWRGPGLWPSTALVVIAYIAHSWVDLSVIVPMAFVAFIAAAAATDLRGGWSPWRWRPLVLLGEVSYAFYLLHHLVMTAAVEVLEWADPGRRFWFGHQPVLGGAGLFVGGTLLVAVLLAFAMYYGVERPMMRVLRRRPPVRATEAPPPVAAPVPAEALL
jgi:peptidoglycan/LPS O-acetylase OafA/YrhL